MPDPTTTHEWIEKVLEEHRQLNAMVADLRQFLETPRPEVGQKGAHVWSTELTSHLVRLHDALFRKGFGAGLIFLLRKSEEQHRGNTEIHDLSALLHNFVHGKVIVARHRADFFTYL